MRVGIVVSNPMFGPPIKAVLRQGGITEIVEIITDPQRVALVVNTGVVDILVVGQLANDVLQQANDWFTPAARLRVRVALLTSHQNNEILRLATDLMCDGVVDVHQDPVAIHQQLRNLQLTDTERTVMPTTPVPGNHFFASRDQTDITMVEYVALGMTDKEIALAMHLAPQTVRNRLSRMMTDAGVNNRTHLAITWLREQAVSKPLSSAPGETF